jgi:hypothetical protein
MYPQSGVIWLLTELVVLVSFAVLIILLVVEGFEPRKLLLPIFELERFGLDEIVPELFPLNAVPGLLTDDAADVELPKGM